MRYIILLSLLILGSCCQQTGHTQKMQTKIDSLQNKLAHTYRPGFGEFMLGIQIHHAKIWYAGNAQNWPLVQFELDEIKESLDGIREYCTDRPEVASLPMIDAPLDSLGNSIKNKDLPSFKNNFVLLTNTCNNCHRATKHEFNLIKLPDSPPFSNQEFRVQ
jgi:hypothetical protein